MIAAVFSVLAIASSSVPIKVDGFGYLRFVRDGQVVYAKQAELMVKDDKIVTTDDLQLLPAVKLSETPDRISISLQGEITAQYGATSRVVGKLVLADFTDDVRPVESEGYLKMFGEPTLGEAGEGLFGVIRPWVKASAEPTQENLIRVYDSNGNALGTDSDEKAESVAIVETITPVPPSAEFLKAGGVQIVIKDEVILKDGNVYLGEIATVYANADLSPRVAGMAITTVPPLGVPRRVDRSIILGKLKMLGIDTSNVKIVGPTECMVSRESQSITQEEFVQVALAEVSKQFGEVEREFEKPVPDLIAPVGEKLLVVEKIYQSGTAISATVVAYIDSKRINSRTIRLVNKSVPLTLNSGDSVTAVIVSNGIRVEVSAKVRKVDRATGIVTIETETGATLSGRFKSNGTVEVSA